MKRRLYPQKKKPASKSRWNRTAKAASSTLSAPEKSSTPLSGVEDHLYRRGDRRRRRRDQIPQRAKSDSRCKARRRLLAMHRTAGGRRVRRTCLTASLGHSGAELGSPAIPHLLPAKPRRAVNRPRVPSSSPAAHAVNRSMACRDSSPPAAVGLARRHCFAAISVPQDSRAGCSTRSYTAAPAKQLAVATSWSGREDQHAQPRIRCASGADANTNGDGFGAPVKQLRTPQ